MASLKRLPKRIVLLLLSMGLLSVSLVAEGPRAAQDVDVKVDYAVARREILNFELALRGVIASTFSSSYALVQPPKGAYLPGYGVTFSFLINIHRAVIDTPFGPMRRADVATPEAKKRLIEELKDKLIRVVLDNGDSLTQLRKEDAITVIAFMEDQNFPDEPNQNKTIILTALKKDFDEVARKDDKFKEFRQRMKILEY